jgi:acyl-CoA hydrolase
MLSKLHAQPVHHFIRTPAYPWILDTAGFVRAGHVLKLIDIVGSEAAMEHLNKQKKPEDRALVVTASLDRTNFHRPIRLWEMMCLESQVTRVWKSSVETMVKVSAHNILTDETREIATSYLAFVALEPKTRTRTEFPPFKPRGIGERILAKAADLRKQNRIAEGKTAPFIPIEESDHPVSFTKAMTANDANAQSNVFGGIILSLIDEAGSLAAKRQALNGTVTGVQQDRMSFIAPTFIGETVEVKAIVTKTWNTSMEVQVEVDALNPNTGQRRRVASSYLVYVRLGPNGRPGEVPPWTPVTPSQTQRAERADVRRQIRLQEETQAKQLQVSPERPTSWLQGLKNLLNLSE